MTVIAAVITMGSGPFAVALTLPSLYDRSTPLDGRAEATLKSTQGHLNTLVAQPSPVHVIQSETDQAETNQAGANQPGVNQAETGVAGAVESSALNRTGSNGPPADPSPTVVADIPANYLSLYRDAAATCPGLHWSVLAAIGKLESNHGRSTLPGVRTGANPHGAKGPMQFLQSTFDAVIARNPVPAGGATPPSAHNPHDAVHTAAAYLCDNGARGNRNLNDAIFTYNHSRAYVNKVLDAARAYARATPSSAAPASPSPAASPSPSPTPAARPSPPPVAPRKDDHRGSSAALAAVAFARNQIGKPYVWGGNGNPGYDCSGLTTAAYAAAGIKLPRTAQTQYNHGPRLAASAALQPGDLLFFGTPRKIHHVGIFLGGTSMINAPTFGQNVKIQDYRRLRDFMGASRPAK
ncbi:MAG: NlpC/P60 family protein [Pseudonocardiaceae bacterium]